MIWVDWCILAVVLISILVGVFRGFAREILNLLTWALAFGVAWIFGDHLAGLLAAKIAEPAVRIACAYAVLFLGGLLTGAVLTHFLTDWIRDSVFNGIDRTLGGGFGLLRGAVVVILFVLLAGTMGARQDRWWHQSIFVPRLEWLAEGMKVLVPERWLEKIKPGSETVSKSQNQHAF